MKSRTIVCCQRLQPNKSKRTSSALKGTIIPTPHFADPTRLFRCTDTLLWNSDTPSYTDIAAALLGLAAFIQRSYS